MKKNAIVVLTRGYSNVEKYDINLIRRNICLQKIILDRNIKNFDFLILHEGNISMEHQEYIKNKTPKLEITFWNIKDVEPKTAFNNEKNVANEICPPNWLNNHFSLGYKHMCHFWSIDFLNYFNEYKYVIRIDEDCFVEKFDLNILSVMDKEKLDFVCPIFQGQDEPLVIQGLDLIRKEFCHENSIQIETEFNQIKCPYTNFMIVDVENINKNLTIKSFLRKIDECGCIYSNRWGDLPIWGVILDSLLDKSKFREIKDIKYYHESHKKSIN